MSRVRIIEYAPGNFYLEIAKPYKHWLTRAPRTKWERVSDYKRAIVGYRTISVPDRVFKSVEECEQYMVERATYPRVVKEFA